MPIQAFLCFIGWRNSDFFCSHIISCSIFESQIQKEGNLPSILSWNADWSKSSAHGEKVCTRRMPGTCHQLFNLDNYSTFVSSTSTQSEIHLPVLTHCFSAAVFHQQTLSRVSDMTELLSIPPVYFVIPIILAANIVSEIRNVGEMFSNAPVNRVPSRTWKQNPGLVHCETWCARWVPLPWLGVPAHQFCPSWWIVM